MRFLGAETEYAIRFRPAEGATHPGNEALYQAIHDAIRKRVRTVPGRTLLERFSRRLWCENGGSVYYEISPDAPDGGLVEGGTPVCRGPRELLVYQLAQDRLLAEATAEARDELRAAGVAGELALLKNCRDAFGHTYGAQESYEVELASGGALLAWRLGMAALVGLAVVTALVQWAVVLLVLAALFAVAATVGVLMFLVAAFGAIRGRPLLPEVDPGPMFASLRRVEVAFGRAALAPTAAAVGAMVELFAYRRYRRAMIGFLASRAVISGAGTLHADGSFGLSEKGPAMRRVFRWTPSDDDRALFEIGHLSKPLVALAAFDLRRLPGLFARRQRLQLGLSDANRCEVAEYLKIGTTAVVLELCELGRLADAPRLADPIGAVHVASDPSLRGWVALEGGGTIRVLDLQRFYWQRAVDWLADAEAPPLEAHRIVTLWGRTLHALEHHPDALVGQLDWVTKATLLAASPDLPWEARKKIDLRYHELGPDGYFAMLDAAGLCERLVDDAEIEGARHHPPVGTPSERVADEVREESEALPEPAAGPAEVGRVIDLAERRARRRSATTREEPS